MSKRKAILYLLIALICCQLVGCSKKTDNDEREKDGTIEGVSMTIKEGTLTKTGATIIITDKSNTKHVYEEAFRIDKKENGSWKELEGKGNFNAPAYYVNSNGVLELEQDWTHIYGKLKNGEYRLVKYTFLDLDKQITDDDKLYFSVEFVIE